MHVMIPLYNSAAYLFLPEQFLFHASGVAIFLLIWHGEKFDEKRSCD